MIHGYPSIYQIGHKIILDIFSSNVSIEEKIDGSQFSFGKIEGVLKCKSKGAQIIIDAPEKMFNKAIETVKQLEHLLVPEWVYRCEYLASPKHNTLAYNRVPAQNIIIFDINTGNEVYLDHLDKQLEATRLGLECVPLFYEGMVENLEFFRKLLETQSVLGGTRIEGVVVKNYNLFTADKKVMMGKYVSEAFQEIHKGEWRKSNPTSTDIVDELVEKYCTPARWTKAAQHLRDAGTLTESPRDIGDLMKEVPNDILKECEDEIKEILFSHFWPKVRRGVTNGLPEWWKEELLKRSFE